MHKAGIKFLFFEFSGRIDRQSWWIGAIILEVLRYALPISIGLLMGVPWDAQFDAIPDTPEFFLAIALVELFLLRPMLAVSIKRLHDRHRTAWWTVVLFLPQIAILGYQGAGYDLDELLEAPFTTTFAVLWLLITIWLVIEMGFRRGTKGTSKYGADPLEASGVTALQPGPQ